MPAEAGGTGCRMKSLGRLARSVAMMTHRPVIGSLRNSGKSRDSSGVSSGMAIDDYNVRGEAGNSVNHLIELCTIGAVECLDPHASLGRLPNLYTVLTSPSWLAPTITSGDKKRRCEQKLGSELA